LAGCLWFYADESCRVIFVRLPCASCRGASSFRSGRTGRQSEHQNTDICRRVWHYRRPRPAELRVFAPQWRSGENGVDIRHPRLARGWRATVPIVPVHFHCVRTLRRLWWTVEERWLTDRTMSQATASPSAKVSPRTTSTRDPGSLTVVLTKHPFNLVSDHVVIRRIRAIA
jgi:hypothetical protein